MVLFKQNLVQLQNIHLIKILFSPRSSTSNTNLNSVDFTPKNPIPVYQQQESPLVSPTHSDTYPNQVNIIYKKNY